MSMVKVRIVRVPVNERPMPVAVGVRLPRRRVGVVLVLVMSVVAMPVLVHQLLMGVLVLVPLGQM